MYRVPLNLTLSDGLCGYMLLTPPSWLQMYSPWPLILLLLEQMTTQVVGCSHITFIDVELYIQTDG